LSQLPLPAQEANSSCLKIIDRVCGRYRGGGLLLDLLYLFYERHSACDLLVTTVSNAQKSPIVKRDELAVRGTTPLGLTQDDETHLTPDIGGKPGSLFSWDESELQHGR
jgi:hypothetical protein